VLSELATAGSAFFVGAASAAGLAGADFVAFLAGEVVAFAGLALAALALALAGIVILLVVGFGRDEAGRDGSPAAQEIMRTT
jgi:hypothetical protein